MPVTSLLPDRDDDFMAAAATTSPLELAKQSSPAMEDTANQHFIIGDNLRHKAFYDDSIEEFERALHIQDKLLGTDSPVLAKTHYSLGLALRATKNYPQALMHLNKAARIWEVLREQETSKENEEESKEQLSDNYKQDLTNCKLNLARTHHSCGVDLQRRGDYDKSIVEHRKALAIREHLLGRTHLETARSYYVIGCALSDRGDFDEALAELRRALRTRLIVFGRDHGDSREIIDNMCIVVAAKGSMSKEEILAYKAVILQSLDLETQGDDCCRKKNLEEGLVCYRKAMALEEGALGDLHPTTCDIYLRMAEALSELGDLESSLVEFKCAIAIYERMLGKFHVKVANIYNQLAGILMEKGQYDTALNFYAKAYGIYDSILGNHDDTKLAMANLRLAASKERNSKESMGLLKKAEEKFAEREMMAEEKARMKKENNFNNFGSLPGKASPTDKGEVLKESTTTPDVI